MQASHKVKLKFCVLLFLMLVGIFPGFMGCGKEIGDICMQASHSVTLKFCVLLFLFLVGIFLGFI